MIFRQATTEDFEDVVRLTVEGRAALAAQGLDQWQGGNPTPEEIRNDIAAGYTMVAVVDETPEDARLFGPAHVCEGDVCYMVPALPAGTVVGTLAFVDTGEADYDRIMQGAWLENLTNDPAQGEIEFVALHRIATAKAAVRKGVASFMLRAAEELARQRGLRSIRADTHEGNMPMQHTFEKFGMTRCCVVDITNPLEPTKKRIGYEKLL